MGGQSGSTLNRHAVHYHRDSDHGAGVGRIDDSQLGVEETFAGHTVKSFLTEGDRRREYGLVALAGSACIEDPLDLCLRKGTVEELHLIQETRESESARANAGTRRESQDLSIVQIDHAARRSRAVKNPIDIERGRQTGAHHRHVVKSAVIDDIV